MKSLPRKREEKRKGSNSTLPFLLANGYEQNLVNLPNDNSQFVYMKPGEGGTSLSEGTLCTFPARSSPKDPLKSSSFTHFFTQKPHIWEFLIANDKCFENKIFSFYKFPSKFMKRSRKKIREGKIAPKDLFFIYFFYLFFFIYFFYFHFYFIYLFIYFCKIPCTFYPKTRTLFFVIFASPNAHQIHSLSPASV